MGYPAGVPMPVGVGAMPVMGYMSKKDRKRMKKAMKRGYGGHYHRKMKFPKFKF
jgi:hypothetical protein